MKYVRELIFLFLLFHICIFESKAARSQAIDEVIIVHPDKEIVASYFRDDGEVILAVQKRIAPEDEIFGTVDVDIISKNGEVLKSFHGKKRKISIEYDLFIRDYFPSYYNKSQPRDAVVFDKYEVFLKHTSVENRYCALVPPDYLKIVKDGQVRNVVFIMRHEDRIRQYFDDKCAAKDGESEYFSHISHNTFLRLHQIPHAAVILSENFIVVFKGGASSVKLFPVNYDSLLQLALKQFSTSQWPEDILHLIPLYDSEVQKIMGNEEK